MKNFSLLSLTSEIQNSKTKIINLKDIQTYFTPGVVGESLRAFIVKLNITTSKHRRIGPNIAPSHPSQNIPPAIERPVK